MSAQDELVALAARHGVPGLLLRAGLDAVLAEHAHELAEKIRNSAIEESGSGVHCCGRLVGMAADLIDPEVAE
jgi:hypothetical protein